MKRIFTYDNFNLNEGSNTNDWRKSFKKVYDFYLNNKNNYDLEKEELPHIYISDKIDNPSEVMLIAIAFKEDNIQINFMRHSKRRKIIVSDNLLSGFSFEEDGDEISNEEFAKYRKKTQEMSDWLDHISEETFKKTSGIISGTDFTLDISEEELQQERMTEWVKKEVDAVGNKFKFDLFYEKFLDLDITENIKETRQLLIHDLQIDNDEEFGGYYCKLYTTDPFNREAFLVITQFSSSDHHDSETENEDDDIIDEDEVIKMKLTKVKKTRKQEREDLRRESYPTAYYYHVSPSDERASQMVQEIIELLEQLNSE
jgi:hypothetical protein